MIINSYNTLIETNTDILSGIDYSSFRNIVGEKKFVLISDENLFDLYPDAFKNCDYFLINSGEENKNLETVNSVIDFFIEKRIDRSSVIIGFGGGMVCDIAGFAANIYMRGTKFGFVASTLLAQIDAAIGGKNGVNFKNYKNYIGNISQPEFVICDANLLNTLQDIEFKSGLGEVIKYALIHQSQLFDYLINNHQRILNRDVDALNYIVRKCIEIKIDFVTKDVNDRGLRHALNFGHTIGHAIEIIDEIPHGLAVIKGIKAALDISVKSGYCKNDICCNVEELLDLYSYDYSYSIGDKHFKLLINDKKKTGDYLNFVFIKQIGEVEIQKIRIDDLVKALS